MPRKCSICSHEQRQAIDEAILAGESFRNIAKRFRTNVSTVFHHKRDHVGESIRTLQETDEVLRGESLIEYVHKLRERTESLYQEATQLLHEAKAAKDLKGALSAIREAANVTREARGTANLLGQLTGELQQNATPTPGITIVMPTVIAPADPAERAPVIDIALPLRRGH